MLAIPVTQLSYQLPLLLVKGLDKVHGAQLMSGKQGFIQRGGNWDSPPKNLRKIYRLISLLFSLNTSRTPKKCAGLYARNLKMREGGGGGGVVVGYFGIVTQASSQL